MADAILLPGGGDLSPRWYGEQPHPTLYNVDETQDAFDLALARWAIADRIPLLAICRGNQVVNVALGGTLVQDLGPEAEHVNAAAPAHQRMHRHEVGLAAGSVLGGLFGSEALAVQSAHHQAVDALAPGLRVVARAEDGVVEALEHRDAPIVGVQWHPEDPAAPAGQLAVLLEGLAHAVAGQSPVEAVAA